MLCPCTSGKIIAKCCGRFVFSDNEKGMLEEAKREYAKTPEQLMRSRYTAYALGGCGEYLLETWWPASAEHLSAVELAVKSCVWVKLEILEKSQKGDLGWVTFNAWYLNPEDSTQQEPEGEPSVLHECSSFKRAGGRWYYVDGEVSDTSSSL